MALNPGADPLEKLRLLNCSMMGASKKIFLDHKNDINLVVLFQKAVALYRYLSSGEPLDATVLRITSNTPLLALVSRAEDGWCTTELKLFIDNAFKIAGIPEGHGDEEQDPERSHNMCG
jgi:hypothetical protein